MKEWEIIYLVEFYNLFVMLIIDYNILLFIDIVKKEYVAIVALN